MEVTELTATTDSLSSVSTPSGGPESSAGDSVKQKSLSPPATTKPSDGSPTPEAAMPAPRAKNQRIQKSKKTSSGSSKSSSRASSSRSSKSSSPTTDAIEKVQPPSVVIDHSSTKLEPKASPSPIPADSHVEQELEEDIKPADTANAPSASDAGDAKPTRPSRSTAAKAIKRTTPQSQPVDPATVRRSKRKCVTPAHLLTTPDSPQRNSPSSSAATSTLDDAKADSIEKPSAPGGLARRNRTICVGSSYQAQMPPSLTPETIATLPPREQIADREECLWKPDDEKLEAADLDEYCKVAREQQSLAIDEAMEHLYRYDYDLMPALENLEEKEPRKTAKWSNEEMDEFSGFVSSRPKTFNRWAKDLENKTTADIVEFYYKTKRLRCYTSSTFVICDQLKKLCTDDSVECARDGCDNCTKSLFTGPAETMDVDQLTLCPACSLYWRKAKKHRPFAVAVSTERGVRTRQRMKSEESAQKADQSATHTYCFFAEEPQPVAVDKEEWSSTDILACVKGFRKRGKDFDAIAADMPNKTARDIEDFYNENQLRYRLDFLVSLYERESVPTSSGPSRRQRRSAEKAPSAGATDSNRESPSLIATPSGSATPAAIAEALDESDESDDDSDKSNGVKAPLRDPGTRSHMITRNQWRLRATRLS